MPGFECGGVEKFPVMDGGRTRTRTLDPLIKSQLFLQYLAEFRRFTHTSLPIIRNHISY